MPNTYQDEPGEHIQEIEEIIYAPSSWIIRWGTFLFLGIILVFLGLMLFIKYPDTIKVDLIVKRNDSLKYVDETSNIKLYGEIAIPEDEVANIKEGQMVIVKLIRYPFEQYGAIEGRVSYVSEVPFKSKFYQGRVLFDSIILSVSNSEIELKDGMTANAEIITDNATLFSRITRIR